MSSNNRVRLKSNDLTMILLLSQLIDFGPNWNVYRNRNCNNSSNNRNLTRMKTRIVGQTLVFLQSSNQIPVPHVFRKISITEDLYIICLSEV